MNGHEHRAGFAALQHALRGVESEAALDLRVRLGAVALVATLHKYRANLLLEELNLVGGELGSLRVKIGSGPEDAEEEEEVFNMSVHRSG